MSFWSDLTGESAADASKAAAADTYAKQQAAIAKLLGFGDEYASKYADLAKGYDPYVATGGVANTALMRLLEDPSSVRGLPGYQFAMDEGIQALDRSAAARGRLNSGRQNKDVLRFAEGIADQTYGNQLARLMGLGQYGLSATGQQIGTIGTGLGGQFDARKLAYSGDYGSAGTVGQGEIAAANARAAGSQNLLNTGLKLGGMALGAFGGIPGMGGGMSSYGGSIPFGAQPVGAIGADGWRNPDYYNSRGYYGMFG